MLGLWTPIMQGLLLSWYEFPSVRHLEDKLCWDHLIEPMVFFVIRMYFKGWEICVNQEPMGWWLDNLWSNYSFSIFKALLAKLIQATLYTSPVTWAPSASSLHYLGAWPLQHEEPRLLLALLLHAHSFNFSLFVLQKICIKLLYL